MATTGWSISKNASGTLAFRALTINETPSSQSNTDFSVLGMLTVTASKTLAPTGGTITMSGTGWGITNNNVLTFQGLKISGTPSSQPSASFSIAGTLTVDNPYTFAPTGGTITCNNGATITNNGTLTFQALTIADSATVGTNGSFSAVGNLTIGNSSILNPNPTTIISGSGTLTGTGTARATRTTSTADFSSQYSISNKTLTNLTIEYYGTDSQIINALTYNNLKINPQANSKTWTFEAGSPRVTGVFTVSNGTSTSTIVTAATNATTLDVDNDFTILDNTTFIANAANNLTIGGNFTETGTGAFTHSSSTVFFDAGDTGNTINSGSDFNSVTFSNAAGGWSFSATTTIAGNLTVTTSETAGNGVNTNNQTINVTGNVTINGGKLTAGSATINVAGSWDSSEGTWVWNTSTVNLTGSGNLKTDGNYTNMFNILTAAASTKTTTMQSSFWAHYLTLGGGILSGAPYYVTVSGSNDVLTHNNSTINITSLYFRPSGNENSNQYIPGKDYGSVNLLCWPVGTADPYNHYCKMKGNVTTTGNITSYPNGVDDVANIDTSPDGGTNVYNISANNLYLGQNATTNSGALIARSATVTLSGGLYIYESGSSITMGSSVWSVAGNWTNSAGGTFTADTSTVTFNGNANQTINNNSQSFNSIILNNTGTTPGTNDKLIISGNLTANANFTLTDGTLDLDTNDPVVQLGDDSGTGNVTFDGGNIINSSTGSNFILNDNPTEFTDNVGITLGNVVIGQSPATTNLKSDMSASSLTVSAGDNYNTRGWEVDIGTGGISIAGNFNTTDTGGANYDTSDGSIVTTEGNFTISGSGTFTKDSGTYKSLVKPDGGTTKTFTSLSQDMGDVRISVASTHIDLQDALNADAVTIDASTTLDANSKNITCAGNWANSGTFTPGTQTVTFDGAANQLVTTNANSFSTFITNNSGSTPGTNDLITISGNLTTTTLTVTDGTLKLDTNNPVTDISSNVTIGASGTLVASASAAFTVAGDWSKSGTFTHSNGTVTFDGISTSPGQTVTGNTTFYDLIIDPAGTVSTKYNFTAGSTTTISHTWTVTGATSNLVTMTSTNTSEWNVQPAAATVDYASVDYSNSNLYICATHSTDGGHNNVNGNWAFTGGTSCNTAPDDPTDLAQKKTTDVVIATGGWTNEIAVPARSVKFTATVADDDSDQVKICVEKQPIATALTGTEDGCGSLAASGGTATYTISGQTDATEYHWQAKAVDEHGTSSSWVTYGANTENPPTNPAARDYGIDLTAPTGLTVYDGTETGVQHDYNDGSITQLSANWTSADFGASGPLIPNRYKYSIGTTAGGTDIKALTDIDTTSVTAGSLSIHTGQIYYFTVKAYDNAGNITTISSSGQQVLPTFTVSLDSYDVDLGVWEDPTFTGTGSNTITTTTNAYHGYLVYLYKADDCLHLETDVATTIANIVADWNTPAAWPGAGFGYTSNDTSVQGSNRFNNGTYYAYIPTRDGTTNPGDIVADESTPQTSGQQFMITYKVQTSATQTAGRYTTSLVYTVVPEY
jgi:hypothetical protein